MSDNLVEKIDSIIEDLEEVRSILSNESSSDRTKEPKSRSNKEHKKETKPKKTPKKPVEPNEVEQPPEPEVLAEGSFDGYNMVTAEGQAYEVPPNYAAKSKLVYGDKLALTIENGRNMYKQLEKVERMSTHGLLTRRDDGWHIITESGIYKVQDGSVEFNKGVEGMEAEVLIPANNFSVPFATLDKIHTEDKEHTPGNNPGPREGNNGDAIDSTPRTSQNLPSDPRIVHDDDLR